MDKDRGEGKVKDIAGRAQRQVGEWTGDSEAQAKGAAKQAEGKVQNAWGKAKDAVKQSTDRADDADTAEIEDQESAARRRRAS
ncbi:MAG TPA: CsbD family protein [Candidatus Binatia bacterium]|nr:CsbD family protein [Candidatus Binatia bacterium]